VRIGELATATGTTARALRHYEQAGLISSERASNGYRLYDEQAVVRVRNIRHLLAAGLTLDDVRVFLPCLDGDVAAVGVGEAAHVARRERARQSLGDRLERLAQPGPHLPHIGVVGLEPLAQRVEACLLLAGGDALLEEREEVLFLVVVVMLGGLREVAHDRLRRDARFRVHAGRGDVCLEALEGIQLPLDAPMAGEEHFEGIVEPHGRIEKARARGPFHPGWTGRARQGFCSGQPARSAITT